MMLRAPWLLTFALLFTVGLPGPVRAETSAPPAAAEAEQPLDFEQLERERRARQNRFPVNKRVSRYLAAAAKASDEGTPEEGGALLDKLNLKRLNPYERALIYRLRGYLAYSAGNYDGTIENFRSVLNEQIMSLDADNRIRFNIAQLFAALQQWQNVIDALGEWFHYAQEPSPLAHYLEGLSYYQLKEIDKAIASTEKAIDLTDEPAESWLQLLAALFIQKEDYANATPVLEELLVRFPKKQYWGQLSLIYGARDDYRHSLAVQQVAYAQGLLTKDRELRRLARSYLYHELPYPAAKILQQGLDTGKVEPDVQAYELLANSWIAARQYDKALGPLQKAAELSEDGKLFIRLGQVLLQREEWGEAAERVRQGVEKGGLDDPGAAQLLLGIAYYEAQNPSRARSAFVRARQHDKARAEADRWITHIDNEVGRG